MKTLWLAVLIAGVAVGQAPQVPLTGNIGAAGPFPLFNGGNVVMADADYTLAYPQTTFISMNVTSSVPLTAARNLVLPLGRYSYFIENTTSGSQNIVAGASSGATVTIPYGSWAVLLGDGTNYGTIASGGGSSGVSSIDSQTGAFTFGGAGVSHTGTAYTFSGGASFPTAAQYSMLFYAAGGSTVSPTFTGTVGLSYGVGSLEIMDPNANLVVQQTSNTSTADLLYVYGPGRSSNIPKLEVLASGATKITSADTTNAGLSVSVPVGGGSILLAGNGASGITIDNAGNVAAKSLNCGYSTCTSSMTISAGGHISPDNAGGVVIANALGNQTAGVSITGAPTGAGQVLTTTGYAGATWQTAAGVTTPTNGATLVSTKTSGVVAGLTKTAGTEIFGDSYPCGAGASVASLTGYASLFTKDTPGRLTGTANNCIRGMTTPQIAIVELGTMVYDPALPTIVLMDGGLNDNNNDACSYLAGTNCLKNFILSEQNNVYWAAIPNNGGFRQLASTATNTGTVAADTTVPLQIPAYTAAVGTAINYTSSGATATWTVPSSASPGIVLHYVATNSATGTFTLSIDGTLQTDYCSGTTTFSTGPCGGQAIVFATTTPATTVASGPSAPFGQVFTFGTTNISHTVVMTTLSATSVKIIGIAAIPPASAATNVNTVIVQGVPSLSAFHSTNGVYNTAVVNVVNAAATFGLPVLLDDMVNGRFGTNITADTSITATANCSASQSANHPNSCGDTDIEYDILYNTLLNAGYPIFAWNEGSNSNANSGPISATLGGTTLFAQESHNMNAGVQAMALIDFSRSGNNVHGITGFYTSNSATDTLVPWSGQPINVFGAGISGDWTCTGIYDASGIGGSSHIAGRDCFNDSTGDLAINGLPSYKIPLSNVTSAATLAAPTRYTMYMSGSAVVTTIPTPFFGTSFSGSIRYIAVTSSTWCLGSGGNIKVTANYCPAVGQEVQLDWDATNALWVIPNLVSAVPSENVVTFSTTPAFLPAYQSNIITLTASLTSWTMAAGVAGQSEALTFCQNATGSFTTGTAPANVRGFFTIGTTASKCSTQEFIYSANQTAWLAQTSGVINQ